MSIELKSSSSKMPKALKLLNSVSSFLFEEECGELKALRKAAEVILKAYTRNLKKVKVRD